MRSRGAYCLLFSSVLRASCTAIDHLDIDEGLGRLGSSGWQGDPSGSNLVHYSFAPPSTPDRPQDSPRRFASTNGQPSPANALLDVSWDSTENFLKHSPDAFVSGWPDSPGSMDQFSAWRTQMGLFDHLNPSPSIHSSDHHELQPLFNFEPLEDTIPPVARFDSLAPRVGFPDMPRRSSAAHHESSRTSPLEADRIDAASIAGMELSSRPLNNPESSGKPGKTETVPRKTRAKPQKAASKPQKSTLKPQKSIAKPKKTRAKPDQAPSLQPQNFKVKTRKLSAITEETSERPLQSTSGLNAQSPQSSLEPSPKSSTHSPDSSLESQEDIERRNLMTARPDVIPRIRESANLWDFGFPRLIFDWRAFVKDKSEIRNHKLSMLLKRQKLDEDQVMYISESHFESKMNRKHGVEKYMRHEIPEKSKVKSSGLLFSDEAPASEKYLTRGDFWLTKAPIIMSGEYTELWTRYWSGIDLGSYKSRFKNKNLGALFPLYLFYVEMINTIVPRQDPHPPEYLEEMKMACESFVASSHVVFPREGEPKLTALVDVKQAQTNAGHEKIHGYIRGRSYHSTLWAYLESWLYKHRPTLFAPHGDINKSAFTSLGRNFFDDIFSLTIENFTDFYHQLQTAHLQKLYPSLKLPIH
ncbi:hypothetical protein MJO28_007389 [Puccinia striiformis f. sp. tritici]|uniref:Uncharacterized protein n=1 Tax=Puccinia striiformis f. sp. tritici TaxID=168172 RepID=A0ACC0EEA9_9BASI|nr:hypothetical protein MJO28_007389 [Puccinia striiformis f. sp. tritici]